MANYNNKIPYNFGDEYGHWTIIGDSQRTGHNNSVYVKCRCVCGNIKDVEYRNLRRGFSKSCGCVKSQTPRVRHKINIGDTYGKLKVVERVKVNGRVHWKCVCECGNQTVVRSNRLKMGVTQSCGCLKSNASDFLKSQFKMSFKEWCLENNLEHVLNLWDYELNKCTPENVGYKSGRKFYFKCPNGLHESELFQIANSVNNFLQCGYFFICRKCMQQSSQPEEHINNFLYNFGYKYERQYRFSDCKDEKLLPFDFYLPDFNVAIEYDGEQHYMPVNFGYSDKGELNKKFEDTQKHDIIKTDYCKANKITLIRIPYYAIDDLEEIKFYLWDQFVKYGLIVESDVA